MAEIPEDALHAAARALERQIETGADADILLARVALEAAAPILAAHIARRIRAQQPAGNTRLTWRSGRDRAAKVARETYPPTREQP